MPVENIYKVDRNQWKKWTRDGRQVFNDLYGMSIEDRHMFHHPDMDLIEPKYWNTIAWNHAWMAADFISMDQKDKY